MRKKIPGGKMYRGKWGIENTVPEDAR
jgi:hypothetical protein